MRSGTGLALRGLLWTILLPGTVAGVVPWHLLGLRDVALDGRDPAHWTGIASLAIGALLLAHCIREFARTGRGTLSPADPPTVLVVRGPYRYVRNPMYLGLFLVLIGELLLARSREMLAYATVAIVIVNLFVRFYEEPRLRDRFGADYLRYTRDVDRWLPRIPLPRRAPRVSSHSEAPSHRDPD